MRSSILRGCVLFPFVWWVSIGVAQAQTSTATPDTRADAAVLAMTRAEKLSLVFGWFGSLQEDSPYRPPLGARMGSAGYVPGIARLGLPPLWETDAGLGVAAQRESPIPYPQRTSLPSGIATAATWNTDLAFRAGAMIGAEARASGFNVMLAGGVNLAREPRNGRNFEYAGEDPLLAGTMVAAQVRGIQSNHVLSTIKHFAFNAQETGRMGMSAHVADDQARMSDLLAFELAIEQAAPGAVMCAYNRVDGIPACQNDYLLNGVLKRDWGYPGFVMSDWGAVHSTVAAARSGLDQESAWSFDAKPFFGAPLARALRMGKVSEARLNDMVRRITRQMYATGIVDDPVAIGPIDVKADGAVSQSDAEEGVVLLKNSGNLLPLARSASRITIIGGHADKGVLAGGGSSTVYPVGGNPLPGLAPLDWPGPIVYHPSSPVTAIEARLPAPISYLDGRDVQAAAKAAAESDLVIVFATQWAAESHDVALTLDDNQDALITAVSQANPNTIVVLETGGPVLMPWLAKVPAVIEAWYPGTSGGEAIARVLFGEVDASGRLPITFPRDAAQLPNPKLPGKGRSEDARFAVTYQEGAAVGYKWYDKKALEPLFPFGAGLSYTNFAYSGLSVRCIDGQAVATFRVTNTGVRVGKAVPQVYVVSDQPDWEAPRRLAAWAKVELKPGESREITVRIDPRLLATFNSRKHSWQIAKGRYAVSLGSSARTFIETIPLTLASSDAPASQSNTLRLREPAGRATAKE